MASNQNHQHTLPPITQLTDQLSPVDINHPIQGAEARDSGHWSIPQRTDLTILDSSTVSNNASLNLQTILNNDNLPPYQQPLQGTQSLAGRRLSRPIFTSSQPSHFPYQPIVAAPGDGHGPSHGSAWPGDYSAGIRLSSEAPSVFDSRRSSVDSRMNSGFGHLVLASPQSPYESHNISRTSLVSNLQQQRGIGNTMQPPPSPLVDRFPFGGMSHASANNHRGQMARGPMIAPHRSVSHMPDPFALAPTPGYPWAFPDNREAGGVGSAEGGGFDRRPSSNDSMDNALQQSRHNSYASSIMTTDSYLPPGQRRLDDVAELGHTHHHSLQVQHRAVTSLQSDGQPTTSIGNYSRTPELRVSHKMAERKRRSEMKGLFDELNSTLPNTPGGKSSKWEVLTKAIEYIRQLRSECRTAHAAAAAATANAADPAEFASLRAELQACYEQLATSQQSVPLGPFGQSLLERQSREEGYGGGPSLLLAPPAPQAGEIQYPPFCQVAPSAT